MAKSNEQGGTPIGKANDAPTVTASIKGAAVEVPAGGLLDNLKGLDFSRVVVIIEDGAAAAVSKDWFRLVADAGELAQILGGLGAPTGTGDVKMFAKMETAACAPHFDRFDKACEALASARSATFSIPPQQVRAGAEPGPAPALALDPQLILVAMELFTKVVEAFKAWRANR